jgi:hypothetical protein
MGSRHCRSKEVSYRLLDFRSKEASHRLLDFVSLALRMPRRSPPMWLRVKVRGRELHCRRREELRPTDMKEADEDVVQERRENCA